MSYTKRRTPQRRRVGPKRRRKRRGLGLFIMILIVTSLVASIIIISLSIP
ncbi:MAG: hypothetical protein Lokiarch_14530 [Candidatus Lokiarchaeum sp. GC14_75]|nr:MAG: hypothetical protein Lokiarch_14530 [Candidatus Lokiarchaeum sp. GC14_75]